MTERTFTEYSNERLKQQYVVEVWNPYNPDIESVTIDVVTISEIDIEAFGAEIGWDYFLQNTI